MEASPIDWASANGSCQCCIDFGIFHALNSFKHAVGPAFMQMRAAVNDVHRSNSNNNFVIEDTPLYQFIQIQFQPRIQFKFHFRILCDSWMLSKILSKNFRIKKILISIFNFSIELFFNFLINYIQLKFFSMLIIFLFISFEIWNFWNWIIFQF